MDHTALNLRLGEGGVDGIHEPGQPVDRCNQDILNAAVFQARQHIQPIFCRFRCAKPDARNVLFPIQIRADGDSMSK